MRVVFLDRDGVINRDRDDYVKSVDEFEFLPGALDALRRLSDAGIRIVVISNQAGVAKGLISPDTLAEINRHMLSSISDAGGEIAGVYYCPHRPEDKCDCRKPAPGLILRACDEMGVDPKDTVFIGDAGRDIAAGRAAGCRTIIVLTGAAAAGDVNKLDPAPDLVAADLGAAVDWLLLEEYASGT